MTHRKKIYFASDFHLGAPNHADSLVREKKVVAWLNQIQHNAEAIYLMGDVFDWWFEYKQVIPKGFARLQGKIAELTDAGVEVHFFPGNHDLWTFGYLQDELGVQVHRHNLSTTFQGKTFYLGHGDGLGPGDAMYKLLKHFFMSKVSQWFFALVHPNFSFWLAKKWSNASRKSCVNYKKKFLGEEEWLIKYAREVLAEKPINFFVFGHRHIPIDTPLSESSRYINLGDWVEEFTYAELANGEMYLKKFTD